jgi:serine/threonine-protein kinase
MTLTSRVALAKRVGAGSGVSYGHLYVTSEETTVALIPAGYPRSVCVPSSPPAAGALATIDCRQSTQPGGPAAARYSLFANAGDLNVHFDESIKLNDELLPCPGSNADSPTSWNYNATPDQVAGRVACGTYKGSADVMWTQDKDLMLADIQSDNLDALHTWFLNYS